MELESGPTLALEKESTLRVLTTTSVDQVHLGQFNTEACHAQPGKDPKAMKTEVGTKNPHFGLLN